MSATANKSFLLLFFKKELLSCFLPSFLDRLTPVWRIAAQMPREGVDMARADAAAPANDGGAGSNPPIRPTTI